MPFENILQLKLQQYKTKMKSRGRERERERDKGLGLPKLIIPNSQEWNPFEMLKKKREEKSIKSMERKRKWTRICVFVVCAPLNFFIFFSFFHFLLSRNDSVMFCSAELSKCNFISVRIMCELFERLNVIPSDNNTNKKKFSTFQDVTFLTELRI